MNTFDKNGEKMAEDFIGFHDFNAWDKYHELMTTFDKDGTSFGNSKVTGTQMRSATSLITFQTVFIQQSMDLLY